MILIRKERHNSRINLIIKNAKKEEMEYQKVNMKKQSGNTGYYTKEIGRAHV